MQATIPPAGAICLSGHMLQSVSYKNLKKFPILLEHGNKDPIIK
jgi:predicted esterase